ncbi:anti-sigma factor family protein [Candidatus Poriferisocius sp.]|uniref:anti-sigma factor family protein n=1 Tax=Candidatus Poriferisocius sp. TaxID=3101276 RepID=UPI003B597C08
MSDDHGEMTPEERDELASAHLDGETTPAESARVSSDPDLQAVVEEFRSIKDLSAAPVEASLPELPAEVRDQMITRALDHRAPVESLGRARRRLRSVPTSARVVLAAAAAVIAVAVIGVTLIDRSDDDTGDTFASNDAAPSDTASSDAAMPASGESDDAGLLPRAESAEQTGPAEETMSADEATAEEPEEADEGFVPMYDDSDEAPASEEAPAAPDAPLEPMDEPAAPAPVSGPDSPDGAPPSDADATEEEPLGDAAMVAEASPLVFDSAAELVDHLNQRAQLAPETWRADGVEAPLAVDLLGCPGSPTSDLRLVERFPVVVEGSDGQASVYVGDGQLLVTYTTPPPDCDLLRSVDALEASE